MRIGAIEGLRRDWSAVLDEEGNQTQTVGHHFSGSRPLDSRERAMLDRKGVCLSCHQEIPNASLAVDVLHHVATVTGQFPESGAEHGALLHKGLLIAGWSQLGCLSWAGRSFSWAWPSGGGAAERREEAVILL